MKRTNRKLLILIWRMLREGAGLSQQELADHLNVDRMVVSRIENGLQNCSRELGFQIIVACGGKNFIRQVISELLSLLNWPNTDQALFA